MIPWRTREELEALSRKDIQQLAIKANLKANQKTANLIDALLAQAPCKEQAGHRPALCDVSNHADLASPHRREAHGAVNAAEDDLAEHLSRCCLSSGGGPLPPMKSNPKGDDDACAGDAQRPAEREGDTSTCHATSGPGKESWEDEEGEMETIRETLAQLLELGFSEEEAQVGVAEQTTALSSVCQT